MPTNRAAMKGSQQGVYPYPRIQALTAYEGILGINIGLGGPVGGLAARFASFTDTVQTRLNSGGGGTATTLGGTLEAQVDRALSQAVRQAAASNGNLPAVALGRSVATIVSGTGGPTPAMSPFQASLLREASITKNDFMSVLETVQPLSMFADPGDVGSLQALVRVEVQLLLEEFAYNRLVPRQQRVRVLLGGLLGWSYDNPLGGGPVPASPLAAGAPSGDLLTLVTFLNLGGAIIPTLSVEDQLASQQVLGTDSALFDTQWVNYVASISGTRRPFPIFPAGYSWPLWESTAPPGVSNGLADLTPRTFAFGPAHPPIPLVTQAPQQAQQVPWGLVAVTNLTNPANAFSFAEKMIQADLLLPVIVQDAATVVGALEAIGFSQGQMETIQLTLWSLVDADLAPAVFGAVAPLPVPPVDPGFIPNLGGAGGWAANGGSALNTPIPVYTTIGDIVDWARTLGGPSSLDQLRLAGALGLNLICEQADELFWLCVALLDATAADQVPELDDAQVQIEIDALARDLNTLANLAY
jgi:hypothetical protein